MEVSGYERRLKRARKVGLLDKMNLVVPWVYPVSFGTPHAPAPCAKYSLVPFAVEKMPRVDSLQPWSSIFDAATASMLNEMALFCEFVGRDVEAAKLPDWRASLRLRQYLQAPNPGTQLLEPDSAVLACQGPVLENRISVDAAFVSAPSLTKNSNGERVAEMCQTSNGNQARFRMKALMCGDVGTGHLKSRGDSLWVLYRLHSDRVCSLSFLKLLFCALGCSFRGGFFPRLLAASLSTLLSVGAAFGQGEIRGEMGIGLESPIATGAVELVIGADVLMREGGATDAVTAQPNWTVDLRTLVSWSLQDHPLIRSGRAGVRAAAAGVAQARWQYFPTPFVRADAHKGRSAWVAGVRQPLWSGGRLQSDVDAARADELAAEKSFLMVRHEIAHRVASLWLQVVTAKDQLKVARAGFDELLVLQAIMKRRVETGYSPPVDLSLVHARVMQAQSEIDGVQAQMDAAMYQLAQVTGRQIAAERLAVSQPPVGRSALTLDEARVIVEGSPAQQKAQADIDVARGFLAQVTKQNKPTVEARVEYQMGKHSGSAREGYRLFVGLDQSFGAGLSTSAAVEAARAKVDASVGQAEATGRDLVAQILSDQTALNVAIDRADSMGRNLGDMEQVSRSYRRAFDAGRRSWLELLNVIRENTEVHQQLVRARTEAQYYAYLLDVHMRGVEQ